MGNLDSPVTEMFSALLRFSGGGAVAIQPPCTGALQSAPIKRLKIAESINKRWPRKHRGTNSALTCRIPLSFKRFLRIFSFHRNCSCMTLKPKDDASVHAARVLDPTLEVVSL